MKHPGVTIRLAGGLGNQLFMYAFAKALAQRNDVPLYLDISRFARDKTYKRQFLLDRLLPSETLADIWTSRTFPFGHIWKKIDRTWNKRLPLEKRYYVRERYQQFDPEIHNLKITKSVVFDGYWQSPRYFDDIKPNISELICWPKKIQNLVAKDLDIIEKASSPVCLGIRRFEEVHQPKQPIMEVDYFRSAMAKVEKYVEYPHYFVFAQDMNWARKNITSEHSITFAQRRDSHEGVLHDLYLMIHCHHYIISNSSLHWWAAWLNRYKGKIVVAPNVGWPNSDILPVDWLRLVPC